MSLVSVHFDSAESTGSEGDMALVPATTVSQRTEITYCELFNVWKIGDISLRRENTGRFLTSPAFGIVNGPQWVIKFYPNGIFETSKGYISLSLHLHENQGRLPVIDFKFSLLNGEQEAVYYDDPHYITYRPETVTSAMVCARFISKSDAMQHLVDDQLILGCQIAICEDDTVCRSTRIETCFPLPACTLSQDLETIFHGQKFGDTVIEVDGEEFLVYRGILSARSPVFAAMFEHDMNEQKQNRVIITDASPRTVKEMLTFMYTGRSPNVEEMAYDLLPIAEKYNLERLKLMSEKVLATKVTDKNAIELLILADLYGGNQLKKFIIDYIIANGSRFLETSTWASIIRSSLQEHPNLIAEITSTLFTSKLQIL